MYQGQSGIRTYTPDRYTSIDTRFPVPIKSKMKASYHLPMVISSVKIVVIYHPESEFSHGLIFYDLLSEI